MFDVTMGSFDGAETCDTVGLFLLSELSHLPINAGLYRDDLLSVSSLGGRQVEKVGQQMREIFRRHGLGLKVEANMQATDFLDVFLDLKAGTHRAKVKPEQVIHYVHRESNHPAHVLKNIPIEVQRRLILLSSNNTMFKAAKAPFQDALVRASYDHQLVCSPANQPSRRRSRVEICRDRHDWRSCKIRASCVNFQRKQRNFSHNLRKTTRFTHTKCDFNLKLLKFHTLSKILTKKVLK